MSQWRSGGVEGGLTHRARLLGQLREYFAQANVLEVETPLLCSAGVTDPALHNFSVPAGNGERYLQTSPEYAMKRLIAGGSGDIYQICKAFRMGEQGPRHNPEYTLLEWYRLGFDHHRLIREVGELVSSVLERDGWQVWSWSRLLQHVLGSDIDFSDQQALERRAQAALGEVPQSLDRDALLDLLMSHCVEPAIASWGVVFVVDYPPSQAALARIVSDPSGEPVAARFECYVDGVELANGYWECSDPQDLRSRFAADNQKRRAQGSPERGVDEVFLAAMEAGLPDCAGVALGVDRLLALRLGRSRLDEVLAFGWDRC